jgi:D-glycerate 3-kinase
MGSPHWQQAFLRRHRLPESYLSYAQQWFMPLAERLAAHQNSAARPVLVALNGSQGSGKTTVCDYLRCFVEEHAGLRALSLSLDDFYLTRAEREDLAARIHPLLATRGVPGTHDMMLLRQTLATLLAAEPGTLEVPRFDKSVDDRVPRAAWDEVTEGVDIVLLEGWCLGARAQTEAELAAPVNALEAREDPRGEWRHYVNEVLSREFEPLYQLVDQWVMLGAPSFDCVYRWRLEQEQKLAEHSRGDGIMNASQVARFIQFYERITRHCLAQLPLRVHDFYQLDEARQVTRHRHCESPGSE